MRDRTNRLRQDPSFQAAHRMEMEMEMDLRTDLATLGTEARTGAPLLRA